MRIEDIELHVGTPDFPYTPVRKLEAKCEAATAFSSAPTEDQVNAKLRAMAASVGANAIINLEYNSGVSMTSWRSLKGTGLAVRRESDTMPCPSCAETIKRAAAKCRFCGADLAIVQQPATQPPAASPGARPIAQQPKRPHMAVEYQEPLRSTNNPQWWILAVVAFFILSLILSAM